MSKPIRSAVSDILISNNKEFVNSCNDLKNALKKIRQNNQKAATKITASITAHLAELGKVIIAAHNWAVEEPPGPKRAVSVANISKSRVDTKKSVSRVQLLINEKYVVIRNNALEKLHNDAEKKFAKALDNYASDNKKVEKLLQALLDKINSFYEEFQKALAENNSNQEEVNVKFRANQEKKFLKFKDNVSKMFYNVNEKSHKYLDNLEKTGLKIVEMIRVKKECIFTKYNKSIIHV